MTTLLAMVNRNFFQSPGITAPFVFSLRASNVSIIGTCKENWLNTYAYQKNQFTNEAQRKPDRQPNTQDEQDLMRIRISAHADTGNDSYTISIIPATCC